MTSQSDFVQPPRIAVWLVNLFAPVEEAESILGDLLEEFSHLASKSGVAFARSWYWRQTVKTIAHLFGSGFRVTPWSTAAAVVGGFLLIRFGFKLPEHAIEAVLERYGVFEHHFNAYVFFANDGSKWIEIVMVLTAMVVGCIVGLAAKGREMVATMTLGLVLCSMAGTASLVWLARGQDSMLWQLPWHCVFSLAVVIGGAIVRTRRSAARTRPSAT